MTPEQLANALLAQGGILFFATCVGCFGAGLYCSVTKRPRVRAAWIPVLVLAVLSLVSFLAAVWVGAVA